MAVRAEFDFEKWFKRRFDKKFLVFIFDNDGVTISKKISKDCEFTATSYNLKEACLDFSKMRI